MLTQYFKKSPFLKIFDSTFVNLPVPINISLLWNFGSILSLCLIIQIITGVLLASVYSIGMEFSFSLVFKMMETMDSGWLIRHIHANGASLFFFFLYLHIGRGIYYGSYTYNHTWMVGCTIFLLTMAAAFLGYVLPVNQMSFWGASVITNLFTEVPYIGGSLVKFIWGSVSVGTPTLMRFFTFHFLIPFIILGLVGVHITLFHQTGSNNPLGVSSCGMKSSFHLYFSIKDFMGVLLVITCFSYLCIYKPLMLGDDDNFVEACPSVTPNHIQPEWYFLFAYAILRSIPNKLGGVMALASSVLILYFLPYFNLSLKKSSSFYPLNKILFWLFTVIILLLTWIGAKPVEDPYVLVGQGLTFVYFSYYLISPFTMKFWDFFMKF